MRRVSTMEDLLPLEKGGSLQWFNDLYQQNIAHVYKIALYVLKDPGEAEDLCHDVFLEVIRHPEKYDPCRGNTKTWLAVKTRSRAIDRLRKKQRLFVQGESEVEAASAGIDPTADSVLSKLANENLQRSLRRLPERQREALSATYFQAMPQREWAEQKGYPLGTVKSLVRYGLKNLRKQYLQMGWLEP